MRPLAMYAAVLAVTSGVAHAGWSEYGLGVPSRPLEQLTETSCELSIDVRGGIADGELRLRLDNPGASPIAAFTDIELPRGAVATGLLAGRDAGVPVAAPVSTDRLPKSGVLGADPALLVALPASEHDRPRVRLLVQPIASEGTAMLSVRWAACALLRRGEARAFATLCAVTVARAPAGGC